MMSAIRVVAHLLLAVESERISVWCCPSLRSVRGALWGVVKAQSAVLLSVCVRERWIFFRGRGCVIPGKATSKFLSLLSHARSIVVMHLRENIALTESRSSNFENLASRYKVSWCTFIAQSP
jgi:hypothetical protein